VCKRTEAELSEVKQRVLLLEKVARSAAEARKNEQPRAAVGVGNAGIAEEGELAVEGEQAAERNVTTTTTAPQQIEQQQRTELTVSQLFPYVPSPPTGTQDSADVAQPSTTPNNQFVLLEDAQLLSGAHAQQAAQPAQPPQTP
jgi:hypothetical protein